MVDTNKQVTPCAADRKNTEEECADLIVISLLKICEEDGDSGRWLNLLALFTALLSELLCPEVVVGS